MIKHDHDPGFSNLAQQKVECLKIVIEIAFGHLGPYGHSKKPLVHLFGYHFTGLNVSPGLGIDLIGKELIDFH